ncbi:MAG: response regulator [Candidatus Omnitrophota bacterium]
MADKLKILVVDDKKVIGDLFDYTLGYRGHEITVVDNVQKTLEAIKKEKYDIVFLDIVIPDTDGVEIFKKIKEVAPDLPIVMMSGYSVEERRKEAIEMGAVACLVKPFEMEEVRRIIKGVLAKEV